MDHQQEIDEALKVHRKVTVDSKIMGRAERDAILDKMEATLSFHANRDKYELYAEGLYDVERYDSLEEVAEKLREIAAQEALEATITAREADKKERETKTAAKITDVLYGREQEIDAKGTITVLGHEFRPMTDDEENSYQGASIDDLLICHLNSGNVLFFDGNTGIIRECEEYEEGCIRERIWVLQ